MWWPAIGGLFIGLGGLIDPRVLGVGYETIQSLLDGRIVGVAALSLAVGKALVWSLSLGSGTSGGVLAPLLMIGGALGAILGGFIPGGSVGLWAMVGMSAMMAGTMRAPFTAVIFALELTRDVQLLPGLLIAGIAAEAVTVLWLKRSILTEKVARRGHHLTREYVVDPFEIHRISEVMLEEVPVVTERSRVASLVDTATPEGRWLAEHRAIPVVGPDSKAIGILTLGDVMRASEDGRMGDPIQEVGTADPVVVAEDDVLRVAVLEMIRNNVSQLPVVDSYESRRLVGFIDRSCVMDARVRWYEEEHLRETPRTLRTKVGR
jgi:CBS domain-containing protein